MKNVVSISQTVSADDIAEQISDSMNNDECLDFVKELDRNMCDWDFTKKCFNYFRVEMEEHAKETAK